MRIHFILLAFLLHPVSLVAQWIQEASVAQTNVPSLFVGEDLFLVGSDSAVYRTTDVDEDFMRSGTLPSTPDYVDAVCTFEGRTLAGTGTQGVYSSLDAGATWQDLSNGFGGLGGNNMRAFATLNGELYCGTVGNGTYRLNGTTWQQFGTLQGMTAGNVNMVRTIGDTLWAGAGGNGYIWYITAGAADWTPVLVAPIDGDSHMITDIIHVPGALVAGTSYGIHRSTDNGATWSLAPGVGPAENIRLAQWGDTLFAARNTAITRLYSSTDNGLTWTARGNLPLVYAMEVFGDRLYTGRIDGLWYRTNATTAIGEQGLGSRFRVHPVPATEAVYVERTNTDRAEICVIDPHGRVVRRINSTTERERIALQGLACGTYVLRVTEASAVTMQRMVVE